MGCILDVAVDLELDGGFVEVLGGTRGRERSVLEVAS